MLLHRGPLWRSYQDEIVKAHRHALAIARSSATAFDTSVRIASVSVTFRPMRISTFLIALSSAAASSIGIRISIPLVAWAIVSDIAIPHALVKLSVDSLP